MLKRITQIVFFTRRSYTIEDIYEKDEENSGSNLRPFTVCLQFNREMKAYVLDHFQEDEIVNNPDGTINVKKNYYTIDQAITQIISLENKVRIIYPKELILKFIKRLDDTKKLYRDYRL